MRQITGTPATDSTIFAQNKGISLGYPLLSFARTKSKSNAQKRKQEDKRARGQIAEAPVDHIPPVAPHKVIFLDYPILLATFAVLLALAAARETNLGSTALFILLLTALYNLMIIILRWSSSVEDTLAQQSIRASIALESVFIGLLALISIGQQQLFLNLITILLTAIAFVFFLRSQGSSDAQATDEILPSKNELMAIAPPKEPAYRSSHGSSIPIPMQNLPAPPSSYPPSHMEAPPRESSKQPQSLLFENDPLYTFPHATQQTRFFVVAKSNDDLVKCEDACAISEDRRVYGLSDGVSSSNFPRPWASLLAQSWVNNPKEFSQSVKEQRLDDWIDRLSAQWKEWIYRVWLPAINNRNSAQGQPPIPSSVADDVIQGGASATFLGLRFNSQNWECFAIGDTCLFLLRKDEHGNYTCQRAFPIERSSDFNSNPATLSTLPNANTRIHVHYLYESLQPEDIFVLATDALATWILQCVEEGRSSIWPYLLGIQNDQKFKKFVNQMRKNRDQLHMNDDDTSLMIIETAKLLRH